MTKFLQRLQLALWATAIIIAIVFQFGGLNGELYNVPAMGTYMLNLVGVLLVLISGYFVLAQRQHRVARMLIVNVAILCTEVFYFMMMPGGTTMMYSFLIALLLSLVAYPIREPKKADTSDEVTAPMENEISERSADVVSVENNTTETED